MDEVRYTVNTTLEREDYRKFLYLATFCRSRAVVPMIAALALAGALVIGRV